MDGLGASKSDSLASDYSEKVGLRTPMVAVGSLNQFPLRDAFEQRVHLPRKGYASHWLAVPKKTCASIRPSTRRKQQRLKICHWEANSLPETAFGARGAEKGLLSQKSVAEPEEYRGPPTYVLNRLLRRR